MAEVMHYGGQWAALRGRGVTLGPHVDRSALIYRPHLWASWTWFSDRLGWRVGAWLRLVSDNLPGFS